MLYSLYQRRVNNVKEEFEKIWIKVLNNASIELIDEVLSGFILHCEKDNIDSDDYETIVLPDVYKGNKVINTKTQEIGTIHEIIEPRYVLVKNIINSRSNSIINHMIRWNTIDLFVLDNTEE